jgi:hypothetical protein
VILALLWRCFGWHAAASPFVVWITFGADVLYHPVARSPLAAWDNTTYYGYGYWAFPVGWYYLAWGIVGGRRRTMPASALYIQAILGAIAAIALWWI